MKNSPFNPAHQEKDISSKIVAGMERISEVFKVLLWEKAKLVGLSPIQIQIVLFVAFHKQNLCNVSHLAKEFNVTKPTISDAVRVLTKKGIVSKDYSSEDHRSFSLKLTQQGEEIVKETHAFAQPLASQINSFESTELDDLLDILNRLIFKLHKSGALTVQRMCFGCKFHQQKDNKNYCNLLEIELETQDLRLDCPEYVSKAAD